MNGIFNNVQGLILGIFGLIVLVVGAALAASSKKAKYSETARISVNLVVAIIIIAVGLGAVGFAAFGQRLLHALGII